jgi:hypothetical protein
MLEYYKTTKTVGEFISDECQYDYNPVHQRPEREPKMIGTTSSSKAQGIIGAMLMGIDIGQLTVRETDGGKYKYESIDGGHRKRYILAFYNNKFPDFTTKKYYRDMSDEEKKAFKRIELSFCVYKNLMGPQVGLIFRTLNETTPVNHQEMLNSYGNSPIANAVRETVRLISQVKSEHAPHQLFEYNLRATDNKQNYVYVSFNNSGLRIEEMVARIFYRYYDGGGLGVSSDDELEKMYADESINDTKAKNLTKKVTNCLDFVLRMAIIRKSVLKGNMTQKEFVLFSRLWMSLEKEYKAFTVKDYMNFFHSINNAYNPYTLPYANQSPALKRRSPFDENKTIGKQFNDSLGEFRPLKSVVFPINRLLKKVKIMDVIITRDKKRLFTVGQKKAKLVEQNYLCAVSGEPITLETSQGAHNIAWSLGGPTNYSNLSMVATHHNINMGSSTVQDYKDRLKDLLDR